MNGWGIYIWIETIAIIAVLIIIFVQLYITDERSKKNEKKIDRLIMKEELKSEQEKGKD